MLRGFVPVAVMPQRDQVLNLQLVSRLKLHSLGLHVLLLNHMIWFIFVSTVWQSGFQWSCVKGWRHPECKCCYPVLQWFLLLCWYDFSNIYAYYYCQLISEMTSGIWKGDCRTVSYGCLSWATCPWSVEHCLCQGAVKVFFTMHHTGLCEGWHTLMPKFNSRLSCHVQGTIGQ